MVDQISHSENQTIDGPAELVIKTGLSANGTAKRRKIKFSRVLVYAMGFAVFESVATVVSAVVNELCIQDRSSFWTALAIDASYSLILAIGLGIILGLFDSGKLNRWVKAGVIAGCLLCLVNTGFNQFGEQLLVPLPDYQVLTFIQTGYMGVLLGVSFGIVEGNIKRSLLLAGVIIVCYLIIGSWSLGAYRAYYLFLADGWSIQYDVLNSVFFGGLMGFLIGLAKEWNSILFVENGN